MSPAGRVCRTFSTSSRKRDCSARVVRSVLPTAPTSEGNPAGFSTEDIGSILCPFDALREKRVPGCARRAGRVRLFVERTGLGGGLYFEPAAMNARFLGL